MTHSQPAPSHHEDALPGHPANGQHGSALDPVVVAGVQVAAHAEVGDLDVTPAALLLSAVAPLAAHQAVASRQVAVHKVEGGEEFHSRGDLAGHGDEGWVTGGKRHALGWNLRIISSRGRHGRTIRRTGLCPVGRSTFLGRPGCDKKEIKSFRYFFSAAAHNGFRDTKRSPLVDFLDTGSVQ